MTQSGLSASARKPLKLEKANSWIAIAANVGVIASIIFLAIEIQQNTRLSSAAALQEIQRDMRDSLLEGDERMADILHKVYACEPVTPVELNQRRLYWERLIRTYENQWYQAQQGLLDVSLLKGYQTYWKITVGWGDEDWWPPAEGEYHPGFVEALSDYLILHPPRLPETFLLLSREKCAD
jgi:hypothetical protein